MRIVRMHVQTEMFLCVLLMLKQHEENDGPEMIAVYPDQCVRYEMPDQPSGRVVAVHPAICAVDVCYDL